MTLLRKLAAIACIVLGYMALTAPLLAVGGLVVESLIVVAWSVVVVPIVYLVWRVEWC